MAQETLYLKWRPKDFDDVVGQSHVTRTLRNACRSQRIAHAYLFAGPRGTGKTSIARILAKALNCLAEPEYRPCNQCHVCQAINQGRFLDLIEIDGASNRGIDEIRDLRERVNFRPNEGSYKVYIIDEVHMLTREAFNALLKTLEEPPEYVVFVFATTEVWRIPATIRSRTQRFDFHPIKLALVESRLRHICEAENIGREDQALSLIARQATGSLRDAISMLDQIASIGEGMVTVDLVRTVLGTAPDEAAEQLLGFLLGGDLAPALELLSQLSAEGFDMRQFAQDVLELSRVMLLLRLGVRPEADLTSEALAKLSDMAGRQEPEALLKLTRVFGQAAEQVRHGLLPQLPLELALVEANGFLSLPARQALVLSQPARSKPEAMPPGQRPTQPTQAQKPAGPAPSVLEAMPQQPVTLERLRKLWPKVGAKVQRRDRTLEPLLRATEPVKLEAGTVTIAFAYPFHCACFSGAEEKSILLEALKEVVGQALDATLVVVAPGGAEANVVIAETPAINEEASIEEDPLYKTAIEELGGQVRLVK
ncbi:MAG: DNA polymerase III subunit gamma/tau [Anaerolineae bacterium]